MIKLRLYTSDVRQRLPVGFVARECTRGDLPLDEGITRGIEVVLATITGGTLREALDRGWEIYDGDLPIDAALSFIDRQTDKQITSSLHDLAGAGEENGILRDQLVQILNTLGLEPTADFARLNDVAITAVTAGAVKKAAL